MWDLCHILDSGTQMKEFVTMTIVCLALFVYYFRHHHQNSGIAYNIPDPGNYFEQFIWLNEFRLECTGVFNLCTDADKERVGLLAIRALHEQMDDDKDGLIESNESIDVSFWILIFIISYVLFCI
jgi:hypothetical protein